MHQGPGAGIPRVQLTALCGDFIRHFAEISSGTLRRTAPIAHTPHTPPSARLPDGNASVTTSQRMHTMPVQTQRGAPPTTRLAPSDNGFITIPSGFPPIPTSIAVASPPVFHSCPQSFPHLGRRLSWGGVRLMSPAACASAGFGKGMHVAAIRRGADGSRSPPGPAG